MTEKEFSDRLRKLADEMKLLGVKLRASEWNNPTPEGMIPDDSFKSAEVMPVLISTKVPRAQAMRVANQLWAQVKNK